MTITPPLEKVRINESRYERLESISWWDQRRLQNARVLVVGAGALGNEILKNLALLGLRKVVIVDKDHIEKSNLTRSILFREKDEGKPKAECAAKAMKAICPDTEPLALNADLLSEVGLGYFNWADAIVGALDNREARVFVNAACASLGKSWVDGGIEILHGIVRVFAPPETACYECTMTRADWDQINQRRSCSLLGRRAAQARGMPTTPTVASVIAAIQVQEVIKALHGLPSLKGEGFFFDGMSHDSSTITYQVKPDCPWHEPPMPVTVCRDIDSTVPLGQLAARAKQHLGGLDALDLSRELIRELQCSKCGRVEEIWRPEEALTEKDATCKKCGADCIPVFIHTIEPGSRLLEMTPQMMGLPKRDIVWARYKETVVGMEIAGDAIGVKTSGEAM